MLSVLKLGTWPCSLQALSCSDTLPHYRQSPGLAPHHPHCITVQPRWGLVLTLARMDPSWTEPLSLLQSDSEPGPGYVACE